jgi:hypothetical protein
MDERARVFQEWHVLFALIKGLILAAAGVRVCPACCQRAVVGFFGLDGLRSAIGCILSG